MRIAIVAGVRPQWVKLGALYPLLARDHEVTLIDTGQHWTKELASELRTDLAIPLADHSLGVREPSRLLRLGQTLSLLEPIISRDSYDRVLVIGDSDPALAGALGASVSGIPLLHAEAGLRSRDRYQVEESNRIAIDAMAVQHYAPTPHCRDNLIAEGHAAAAFTGDLHLDAVRQTLPAARELHTCVEFGVRVGSYLLVTIHRRELLSAPDRLQAVLSAVTATGCPSIWPAHPALAAALSASGPSTQTAHSRSIILAPAQTYARFLSLMLDAKAVITDSGGTQREAYFLDRPCVVTRQATEFFETVERGCATLVPPPSDDVPQALTSLIQSWSKRSHDLSIFGDGQAAARILATLEQPVAGSRAPAVASGRAP